MKSKQPSNNNYRDFYRYAGLGMQLFVSLGVAVFIGYKADLWLKISIPLLVWLLPLITLTAIIYKLIKETSKRNPKNEKE